MKNVEVKLSRIIEWTKIKIRIERKREIKMYFHEREIWWASIGSNVGYEQDGKNKLFERPVLIVKKFGQNLFWGIPMSSVKKKSVYYYVVEYEYDEYSILLTQLRLMSSKRLIRKLRTLAKIEFDLTKEKIKDFL